MGYNRLMTEDKKIAVPGEGKSTEEFIRERSASSWNQLDLITPTSIDVIKRKAKKIKASEISGLGTNLTEGYPYMDRYFADVFDWALDGVAKGDMVNGFDLQKAYELAVVNVRKNTTKSFSHIMYMPDAIGRFADHFDVPVSRDIVEKLESEGNPLAEEYKKRLAKWKE